MKKMLLVLFACTTIRATVLQKVYAHYAPGEYNKKALSHIELAKIAFHFNVMPEMGKTEREDPSRGWKCEEYVFMPDEIRESCKQDLKNLHKETDRYRVLCEHMPDSRSTVRLELSYDPQYIACINETYDAITNEKGTVFRLINKALLDSMSSFEKPLVQVTHNDPAHIVIDTGHGGRDPGAIGVQGAVEKDITSCVGAELALLLRKQGCTVSLTRDTDCYVSLDDRTRIINSIQPNFYVSIHANSAQNPAVSGIETYCLSNALFHGEVNDQIGSLFQKAMHCRYTESNRLACLVHGTLLSDLSSYTVVDRKVKHAVSQLLLGSNVPGILVEIGFVSNESEALRLINKSYQSSVAKAMCDAIMTCLSMQG
jgi:N-acetylmuramoyl-L-alanine amidase